MTAQEQGLADLSTACRMIIPPQLEFVVLIYMPNGEIRLSSVMYPRPPLTNDEQYARAKEAAKAFIETPPRPQFHAPKN